MGLLFSDEQIGAAYDSAPVLVQNTLASDELVAFGMRLESQYHLHVDTVGSVADLIRNLLIGLINPAEFSDELKRLGIENSMVQDIIRDVNETIFIPLRTKMEEGGEDALPQTPSVVAFKKPGAAIVPASSVAPAPSVTPTVPLPPKVASISYANAAPAPVPAPAPVLPNIPTYAQSPAAPAPSLSQFNQPFPVAPAPIATPSAPVAAPAAQPVAPAPQVSARPLPPTPPNLPGTAPVQPVFPQPVAPQSFGNPSAQTPLPATPKPVTAPFPAPAAPAWVPPAPMPAPAAPVPVATPIMRTMGKDMSAVQAGTYEMPHPAPSQPIIAAPAPQPAVAAQPMPTFTPPAPPVQSAPTVTPPSFTPVTPQPRTPAPFVPSPTPNEAELHDTLKQYGIDPYREPVE